MSAVLTVASVVTCSHGAPAVVPPPGTAKLSIAGVPVLLPADLTAATLACPGGPGGAGKCTGIASVVDGVPPAKLTVTGQPVVRDSLTGMTSGVPTTLSGIAGQSTLTTA